MIALIAFVVMALVILTLIEINERIKAPRPKENCPQEKAGSEDCSASELMSVCTKEEKSSGSTPK